MGKSFFKVAISPRISATKARVEERAGYMQTWHLNDSGISPGIPGISKRLRILLLKESKNCTKYQTNRSNMLCVSSDLSISLVFKMQQNYTQLRKKGEEIQKNPLQSERFKRQNHRIEKRRIGKHEEREDSFYTFTDSGVDHGFCLCCKRILAPSLGVSERLGSTSHVHC